MNRENVCLTLGLALFIAGPSFSQVDWQKYQGNPVLVPTQAWETAFGVIGPRIVKVGNVYKMWYTGLGSRRQIGLATSTDGIQWTKSNSNPVLSIGQPGNFDADHVDYPSVLFHDNKYWMWYTGYKNGVRQIGLATSSDGVAWTKYAGNPVLTVGESSAWDAQGAYAPIVIFDGQSFKMWYHGSGLYLQAGGFAESVDGIHWQKYLNNPVFTPQPNSWDSYSIGINTVLLKNGIYQMWYGGGNGSTTFTGYAISQNGVNWERYGSNPIFAPGETGTWDSAALGGFCVLRENNVYKMWYGGRSSEIWQIGYATSSSISPPIPKRFVYLPRIYGLPGDTINVTLSADTVAGISGGDVIINFDPEILKAIKVQPTKFTPNFLIAANLDTPGVARVSLANTQGATGAAGGLFYLQMVVNPSLSIPDPPLTFPLKLFQVVLYTENSKSIPLNKRDGVFVLGRSRGDVNRDGRINAADAILTLRIAAGLLQPTPRQFADADMDANGRVESIDASSILYRAVGLEPPPGGNSIIVADLVITPFSAGAGNQIETQLVVSGVENFLAGDVSLQYDANKLEIVEIKPSAEMSGVAFEANMNNSGKAQFSFGTANSVQAKSIAVVRLRAKTQINEKSLRSTNATFFDAQGRRWNGVVTAIDEPALSGSPTEFHLEQNYPNPFYRAPSTGGVGSTITQIRYTLPQRQHVKLIVYDLYGRQVRVLQDAEKNAGSYTQTWNGLDQFGTPVATGIYVYRLQIGQATLTRKMLMVE